MGITQGGVICDMRNSLFFKKYHVAFREVSCSLSGSIMYSFKKYHAALARRVAWYKVCKGYERRGKGWHAALFSADVFLYAGIELLDYRKHVVGQIVIGFHNHVVGYLVISFGYRARDGGLGVGIAIGQHGYAQCLLERLALQKAPNRPGYRFLACAVEVPFRPYFVNIP